MHAERTSLPKLPSTWHGPDLDQPHREWHGYLTLENADHVAEHLRIVLGGKTFAWACFNDGLPGMGLRIDTGRRLVPATSDESGVTLHRDDDSVHITVCDTYGVWGLSSRLKVQPPAFAKDEDLDEETANARKWAAAIVWGRSESLQTMAYHVELCVPAGHITRWTIAEEGQAS